MNTEKLALLLTKQSLDLHKTKKDKKRFLTQLKRTRIIQLPQVALHLLEHYKGSSGKDIAFLHATRYQPYLSQAIHEDGTVIHNKRERSERAHPYEVKYAVCA